MPWHMNVTFNRTTSMTGVFAIARPLAVIFLLGACSSKPADSGTAASSMPADTGMAMGSSMSGTGNMQNMGAMTGDPDRDFLRMMSDHHKGMIAMVHPTIESKENLSVKPDARLIDKEQDAELNKMITILSNEYKDDYTPKVTPDNQRMVDGLKGKSGKDYSRTFLANTIMHHEEAIKMVNDYLPKAKNAEVKRMAEAIKAGQTKEIAKYRKELPAT